MLLDVQIRDENNVWSVPEQVRSHILDTRAGAAPILLLVIASAELTCDRLLSAEFQARKGPSWQRDAIVQGKENWRCENLCDANAGNLSAKTLHPHTRLGQNDSNSSLTLTSTTCTTNKTRDHSRS